VRNCCGVNSGRELAFGYCRRRRFASGNKIGEHCESVERGNLWFDAGYFASLSFRPIINLSEEVEQTFQMNRKAIFVTKKSTTAEKITIFVIVFSMHISCYAKKN
jgi:hypothetical protein